MQNLVDFILLGATGDLAKRKIFPALYEIYAKGFLNPKSQIIATARTKYSEEEFKKYLDKESKIHIQNCDEKKWLDFIKHISYVSIDFTQKEDFKRLKEKISEKSQNIAIYFSISPEFFMQSCENLALIGLNNPKVKIVLEKPLGKDLKSFRQINKKIAKYYKEQQIYRIDHYLGKESLQNLLILRSNPVFMSLWDKKHIQSVQISVFETLGVEARGEFYDKTGALRDMVQNHLLQILSLVAMKMPQNLDAKSIRAAKLKLLKSLKPLDKNKLKSQVIRAQYAKNSKFKAYLEEQNIQKNSQTETYVALKVEIDNSMWKGVPFYLRTGKRMAKQFAQIAVIFKDKRQENFINKLIIRLQPENFITLSLKTKKVGKGMEIEEKNLNLDFSSNSSKSMKAYERLILEVIEKNQTSFNHKEELEAAWLFVEPILQNWQEQKSPLFYYLAGSFGPKEALELIQKDGNQWYDEI